MSERSSYRPEIDGLRAVAVLGVLLFHVGLGVPGGFVGVDVFFVISGYLITGIILRELRAGRFSLADFWVRRIRRILPASVVMVLVTLCAGFAILTPQAYQALAETALAQALVASNFVFAQQDGYFTESADFAPLLHTWSLAVEEQFYILFPLFLAVAWSRARRRLPAVLICVGVASLAWSIYVVRVDPKGAFFLLPARAWELLIGALLASRSDLRLPVGLAESASALGLAMILGAMVSYDRLTPFPGLHALLPVVGAGLFIFGNQGQLTLAGRLLALKPVVFIGLISYSLYLWHWPLLVFAKHVTVEFDAMWRWSLVVASLLAGVVSWRFVETPFRKRTGGLLSSRAAAFGFAGSSVAVVLAAAVIILQADGLAGRQDGEVALLLEDIDWNGEEFVREDGAPVAIGAEVEKPSFALWGDSHGMALAATVDAAARRAGLGGRAYLSAGVPPVTGLWFAGSSEEERVEMLERNQRIVAELIAQQIPDVILVGRWVARCDGYSDAEMIGREPAFRQVPMVVDELGQQAVPEVSAAALARQLEAMGAKLHQAGIRVWLIKQVPETDDADTAKKVCALKRFPAAGNQLAEFTTTLQQHRDRQANTDRALQGLGSPEVTVIDPSEHFFPDGGRLRIYAERSFYRDDDHLTRPGAELYMRPIFDRLFARIRESL